MLAFCQEDLTPDERAALVRALKDTGFLVQEAGPHVLALFGEGAPEDVQGLPGVIRVGEANGEPLLAGRRGRTGTTIVEVGPVRFGEGFVAIAGPCSVEGRAGLLELAHAVKEAGGDMLRGGAFKPRTSPYSFQGLGVEGLEHLAAAREATGLPVVTEVLDGADVERVADYADMIQIGTRNMMNSALLRRVGRSGRPVLLKRGMSATLPELIFAAEYLLIEGCPGVVLCERGVRTFGNRLRFTLDLGAVPALRTDSHLPVIVDPSHATGLSRFVPSMSRAAAAAGAHGLMVEVHDRPDEALSDRYQAILPAMMPALFRQSREMAALSAAAEKEDQA